MTDIEKMRAVHFIGIGGIGVSAIARMMLSVGKQVSGSDRSESFVTKELSKLGVTIALKHSSKNIPENADCVVFTNALTKDNPELRAARKKNIPVLSYPEMLGIVSEGTYTIAISGTHGKTTTTAMIAKVLKDGGLDPTVVVGSLLKSGSNFVAGNSKYFVVEADEYKKAFLHLHPNILVINNIDEDHLDYYKDLADIQDAFGMLAQRVPADGFVVCDTQNPHIAPVLKELSYSIVDYPMYMLQNVKLQVAGEHNRMNAAAAYAVGKILGIGEDSIEKSLSRFEGTWRRFEYKGKMESGALVYDDYAHNPQKVRAALQGAREKFPNKRITVVFQPHLYSRTKLLLSAFAQAFTAANHVVREMYIRLGKRLCNNKKRPPMRSAWG
ncbi:MAG: Uncharacterized protein G01um101448_765 [Parcubacteria group bacterium Gr01-1014_48]|nr:MAG: Uncharacterized protein G01um101448_765 [Parcubacteria group bacterium Gr01-1014_48]